MRVAMWQRLALGVAVLALVFITAGAIGSFGTPRSEIPLEVKLSLPSNLLAKRYTLSNDVEVWLVRQIDGRISAFSVRSPLSPHYRILPYEPPAPIDNRTPMFTDNFGEYARTGEGLWGHVSNRSLDFFSTRQTSADEIVIEDAHWLTLGWCVSDNTEYCSTPAEAGRQPEKRLRERALPPQLRPIRFGAPILELPMP